MPRPVGSAIDDAEMTFEEIGQRMGIARQQVERHYHTALRKLRASAATLDALLELSEYHHQLRARSAECLDLLERR